MQFHDESLDKSRIVLFYDAVRKKDPTSGAGTVKELITKNIEI